LHKTKKKINTSNDGKGQGRFKILPGDATTLWATLKYQHDPTSDPSPPAAPAQYAIKVIG